MPVLIVISLVDSNRFMPPLEDFRWSAEHETQIWLGKPLTTDEFNKEAPRALAFQARRNRRIAMKTIVIDEPHAEPKRPRGRPTGTLKAVTKRPRRVKNYGTLSILSAKFA